MESSDSPVSVEDAEIFNSPFPDADGRHGALVGELGYAGDGGSQLFAVQAMDL